MKYPEQSYINLKKQVFIAKNILNTGQRYSNRVGKISQKIFVLKWTNWQDMLHVVWYFSGIH